MQANNEDKIKRLIASSGFAQSTIFDNDLAVIQIYKSQPVLNWPVYVGLTVVDISKLLMYDFHYNQLKRHCGKCCQLLYTDTGLLLLEVWTDDVSKDMTNNVHLYDTSDYPKDHPLHSMVNKKVLDKMNDEHAWCPIAEYIRLCSKMYSILEAGVQNMKKAKGMKR